MIGSCECCDRQGVPVKSFYSNAGECTACFICAGWNDPDPYCELEDDPPSPEPQNEAESKTSIERAE